MGNSEMKRDMMHAHLMASLGRNPFFLSLSSQSAELVSGDGLLRISVEALDASGLLAAKHLAHNQYVNAMLLNEDELDAHRATLNFLSKALEREGHPAARPHTSRPAAVRNRKPLVQKSVSRAA